MMDAGRHSRLLRTRESTVHDKLKADGAPLQSEAPSPSEDEARCILNKILSSPEFSSVVQLRAFLAYIVTAAIENRPEEIKGYTIAIEALGRDTSFNPASDPIVRVEAARLRKRLSSYYAGTGSDDPVIIEIPKGSYAPVFVYRAHVGKDGDLQLAPSPPGFDSHAQRALSMPPLTLANYERTAPLDGDDLVLGLSSKQLDWESKDAAHLYYPPGKQPQHLPGLASLLPTAWSSQLLLVAVAIVSFFAGFLIGTF